MTDTGDGTTLDETITAMLDQRRDQVDQRQQAVAAARDRDAAIKASGAAALGDLFAATDTDVQLPQATNAVDDDALLTQLNQHIQETSS